MKRLVQGLAGLLGYEIRNKASSPDAFTVQKALIGHEKPVIFDIGAHVGSVTRRYRGLFPAATIYAFEPFHDTFERLKQNTVHDPLTSIYEVAVSDREGTAILHANAFEDTNSLLSTDSRSSAYWGEGLLETRVCLEVTTTTIDSFCFEKTIPHIDILKLDIQGAEFLALSGAKEMLSKEAVSVIYFEMIMAPTYKGQHRLGEYLTLLESFNCELFDLYNPRRCRMRLIQADILFVGGAAKLAHTT